MQVRELEFWDDDEWKAITAGWPEAVARGFATRLRVVQNGEFPSSCDKPLKGFDIALREMWHRDGQRIVYTTAYASTTNRIYIIDAFEKDSRDGRKMRTSDKTRIEGRIRTLKSQMDQLKAAEGRSTRRGFH